MTWEELQKANDMIKTISIEKKNRKTGETTVSDYAEVNQRIKAFRSVFPMGCILTEMIYHENGTVIFKASIYADGEKILATGTAQEKEDSSFINQTSYIENCETSAVGRALGMCGFGVDRSVASYEEVKNAMLNQTPQEERKASERQLEILNKVYTGENLKKLLESNQIEKLEDITMVKASEIISKLRKEK